MGCYYTKKDLYQQVNEIRATYNISLNSYPLDVLSMCMNDMSVCVDAVDFKTSGLRGMAIVGRDEQEKDIIILNSNRSGGERNFDCCHEFIHLRLHRDEKASSFNCFESIKETQNTFLEWHANEGAAELLVPYSLFLPKVKAAIKSFKTWQDIYYFKELCAEEFIVTPAVINHRCESLKYEIEQFVHGVDIEELKIYSKKQQERLGLKISSINDFENELFSEASVWGAR